MLAIHPPAKPITMPITQRHVASSQLPFTPPSYPDGEHPKLWNRRSSPGGGRAPDCHDHESFGRIVGGRVAAEVPLLGPRQPPSRRSHPSAGDLGNHMNAG